MKLYLPKGHRPIVPRKLLRQALRLWIARKHGRARADVPQMPKRNGSGFHSRPVVWRNPSPFMVRRTTDEGVFGKSQAHREEAVSNHKLPLHVVRLSGVICQGHALIGGQKADWRGRGACPSIGPVLCPPSRWYARRSPGAREDAGPGKSGLAALCAVLQDARRR